MTAEIAIQWFMIFGPLAISPGPANVLFAVSGGTFGIRKSLPFWLGTNVICILQTLAIGLGLGFFITTYPAVVGVFRIIGVVFLLYLAYGFFNLSIRRIEEIKPLSFKQGMVVELLNAKYMLIPTIMFTQFYNPDSDGVLQIVVLTSLLATLTMVSNVIWLTGGKALADALATEKAQKTQGVTFGVILCITAIWVGLG